ncbi:MAG TPA: acyltransferase [Pyrinomonadaceae bacterium]|jgi:peptidoglycan/LPS O-acetylase OafA/YrhL|nr:acyltransferase [Pyrinomonadaceae bacterium]
MKELVSSRLKSIDALRGAAALAVVVYHASTALEVLPSNALWFRIVYAVPSHGHLGVALFFVISGFCIHLRWAKQYAQTGERRLDFGNFWKRRLYRLYPPYFVALCLTMGLVVVAYMVGVSVPLMDIYPEPRAQWMLADFVAHVFMLHGLHPTFDMGGGNGVYWTLAREEYFYIMYWGLLAARLRWGTNKSLAGVLLLGVVFPYAMGLVLPLESPWWNIVNRSAVVLWIQWCLGLMAVEAYYGLIKLPRWCYWGWLVPFWMAAAVLSEHYVPRLEPILWGMSFFTLLNYCVRLERDGRWPKHALFGWFSKVGVFSYSLYLVHNPVRGMVKFALGPLAVTNTHGRFWLTVVVLCVAGYYAGRIFFFLVERRFLTQKLTGASPLIFKNNPQIEVEPGR